MTDQQTAPHIEAEIRKIDRAVPRNGTGVLETTADERELLADALRIAIEHYTQGGTFRPANVPPMRQLKKRIEKM